MAENKQPWRTDIQSLLATPPVLGVHIVVDPVEQSIKGRDYYIRQAISIHCDPDLLEQTARKNADLMNFIAKIDGKLERGELVERQLGRWAYRAPIRRGSAPISDLMKCSVCDSVVERIDGVNYKYCPECGAKMEG